VEYRIEMRGNENHRRTVMSNRPVVRIVAAVAALLCALAASAADNKQVVGNWDLELTYQGQQQAIKLEIAEKEDGTLTGKWIGPHRTNELVDFGWDGKTLTFTRNVERPSGPVALKHKATVEGDSMKGTVSAPEGEVPFTGKRA
jgi:hypothetical protein